MTSKTEENPDNGLLTYSGLQKAFVGVVESYGKAPVACYSKKKTISILVRNKNFSKKEAYDLYEYTYLQSDFGEGTPVFLDDENEYII